MVLRAVVLAIAGTAWFVIPFPGLEPVPVWPTVAQCVIFQQCRCVLFGAEIMVVVREAMEGLAVILLCILLQEEHALEEVV